MWSRPQPEPKPWWSEGSAPCSSAMTDRVVYRKHVQSMSLSCRILSASTLPTLQSVSWARCTLQKELEARVSKDVAARKALERCQAILHRMQNDIAYPLETGLHVLEADSTNQMLEQASFLIAAFCAIIAHLQAFLPLSPSCCFSNFVCAEVLAHFKQSAGHRKPWCISPARSRVWGCQYANSWRCLCHHVSYVLQPITCIFENMTCMFSHRAVCWCLGPAVIGDSGPSQSLTNTMSLSLDGLCCTCMTYIWNVGGSICHLHIQCTYHHSYWTAEFAATVLLLLQLSCKWRTLSWLLLSSKSCKLVAGLTFYPQLNTVHHHIILTCLQCCCLQLSCRFASTAM